VRNPHGYKTAHSSKDWSSNVAKAETWEFNRRAARNGHETANSYSLITQAEPSELL